MKNIICTIIIIMAVIFAACGTTPAVTGLIGLDDALDNAVQDIESKLPSGTPIVVTVITAPHHEARDYLGDALSSRFKNLETLARDSALSAVEKEQDFQMSGIVSDESAVGIGHFIGAQAVISGDMKNYADFTQLRLRIVDVKTSKAFIYMARINNKDRLLANILPTAASSGDRPAKVSTRAIDHLNRGNDLLAEKKFDEALQEFDMAIAINSKFAEAYLKRGIAYAWKGDGDRALTEYNEAIRLRPRYAEAYYYRGMRINNIGYFKLADADYNLDSSSIDYFDRAIADYTRAIQINPNYLDAYFARAESYSNKEDYDLAIADYTSMLRINPNSADAYIARGTMYVLKNDHERAIAEYTSAIRIDPNYAEAYKNRGDVYIGKGDHDRAKADYTRAIRIMRPDNASEYYQRGGMYEKIGDIDNAIADYETAMSMGYNWLKNTIDQLKQQRGR